MNKGRVAKLKILGVVVSNAILFVLEIITICLVVKTNKLKALLYYTDLSNAFALVVSGVMVVCGVVALCKNSPQLPKWIVELRFVSAVMLVITFSIVICFLAPWFGVKGYKLFLFEGSMLLSHTICPLFSTISLFTVERGMIEKIKSTTYVLYPTLGYGLTVLTLNILGVVVGPYPFFMVNHFHWAIITIWCVGVLVWCYLMSLLIWMVARKRKYCYLSRKINILADVEA